MPLIQATPFIVSMQDTKVTISFLTTVLRIPGNVCELDVLFIIQTLAPLGLESVVLTVIHIYQYYIRYIQTCIQTRKQQTQRYFFATVLLERFGYRHTCMLLC